MATKEVTFQNYNAATGEFFTDTRTCTVVDSAYEEGTLGSRDGQEHWYVVDSSINLGWFNVRGDVHLILSDGCKLTADKKTYSYAAVNVEESDSFTIYGQAGGTGKLVAEGGYYGAAIGGDNKETNGQITINGGTVEAYGGDYASGVGGGRKAEGKNITINGGDVTAEGGYKGAGIGGGNQESGSNITITGGTVNATGRDYGAGIGGGNDGDGYDITITGGDVTAKGGSWGAGIGGGDYGYGYDITITGGTVNATTKYSAAGIGGGYDGQGHDITIDGGDVTAEGDWSAGIGGGWNSTGYNITINGGTVTAEATNYGAGIGGGDYKAGYNITINGGDVTAIGANYAAGIGGGDYGEGDNIFINGGTVNATGGEKGAGIGGGYSGEGYNIFINDGTVNATGGDRGAGIGGGSNGEGYDITITDGMVTANGGSAAAGIGGGDSNGHHITISGGTVDANGGDEAAGIGSGYNAESNDRHIVINDGTVTAIGGGKGAGIGSGNFQDGKGITINGGTVNAYGGSQAAGIGGGNGMVTAVVEGNSDQIKDADGCNITVNGGTVHAYGGDYGAGIGGGKTGRGENIVVTGGEVTATGNIREASGIGGGDTVAASTISDDSSIIIKGGQITATSGSDGSGIGNGKDNNEAIITIEGGNIKADGTDSGTAIGSSQKDTEVTVEAEVSVKAGDGYPLETVSHTDGENIASKLEGKRYAETELLNISVDSSLTISESVTYTRGGVVGNGGYYNITTSGSLTNTDCIVTFDSTSTTGNGGAIYNESTVNLANTTFSKCHTANGCGGGIYNQGGTVTLTDVVFDANTSVYGGGSASGGAISMDGGTLNVSGSGTTSVFKNNESWYIGGAIVIDGNATGTFDNVSFESNTSRSGGAAAVSDGTMTVSNSTFTGNSANILGLKGGFGGAFLVSGKGTLNLANVTFEGNTATSGGAVYTEKNGKVNLTGSVCLNTETDTIVNQGTVNWDLTGSSGSTGYLNDYSLLSNDGSLTITVNPNEEFMAAYTLASNAENAAAQTFILTGVAGQADKAITVGGDTVTYNGVYYTLAVNADNELVLSSQGVSTAERIVVSDELIQSNLESRYLSYPDLNGGAFMVESTGDLSVFDSTFTNNTGKNGGAIYNEGTTTLSNVIFNGNTAIEIGSGAVYNIGTLTLNGAVTLSTGSDTIYNSGNLVWNVTTTGNGYLSDWSKLTNAGTLTITGTKDNKCGQYVLAGNAASVVGKEFTIKVGDNEKTLTVGDDPIALNDTYYGRLTVDSGNDLLLTVETNRITVGNGETFTIQDGTVLNGDPAKTLLGGGGVFYVEEGGCLTNDGAAAIRDFSVKSNFYLYGDGGAIKNNDGTVSLSNVTFSNNRCEISGGAIYSTATETRKGDIVLNLDHAVFSGNNAGYSGGALLSNGSCVITNSVFEQNSSDFNAGAMAVSAELTLQNVEFNGNHATHAGGGIDTSGDIYLDNVTFNGNQADDYPESGAIYNSYGNLYIVGNVILATETDTIYSFYGSMTWILDHGKNGYISNYALVTMDTDFPATYAIDADNADVNTSCIIAGNAVSADGQSFNLFDGMITVNGDSVGKAGAYYTLYIDGSNDLRLSVSQRMVVEGETATLAEGLVFTNNGTAYSGDGGAIEVKNGGTLTVQGEENAPVIFRNNAASGDGGAIRIEALSVVTMENVEFSGNAAKNGGAIYNDGTLALESVTFTGNTATGGKGGALFVGEDSTVTVTDATFDGNTAESGGAVYISVGGTLNVTGTLTLSTSSDTIYNAGTLNWNVSASEAESSGYTLCDESLLSGDGEFVITITGFDAEEEAEEAAPLTLGSSSSPETRAAAESPAGRKFIIKKHTGEIIGTIDKDTNLEYDDSYIGLVVDDGKLKLTIVDKPTDLSGDADGVAWKTMAEKSMLQISSNESEETFALVTGDKGVNFYALEEGSYDVRVKNSLGNTWTDVLTINSEYSTETPTAWSSQNNGYTDLFFANSNDVWKSGYVARHVGTLDGWTGTRETVSITGKNKIADIFSGSVKNGSILVLGDDENGDALFLDDIYTAFPDEEQARIENVKEIRAGAGNDLVDMTSQRFDYFGNGMVIRGGAGDDTIWANTGRNYLFGDAGNDRIIGGSKTDVIVGGIGDDTMHGGGGNDIFCFGENWGNDVVEQLSDSTVELWFKDGDESNWNQKTMTYVDGANSVKVTGVTADKVTLKFGDDGSAQFGILSDSGAFKDFSSENAFEEEKGILAIL